MSEASRLPGRRSAFTEAATRLDQVQQSVKQQQVSQVEKPLAAPQRGAAVSPDEIWSRKFMTQAIGPLADASSVSNLPKPQMVQPLDTRTQEFAAADAAPTAPGAATTIRQQLGKPDARKRGWLARLLRGT